MECLAWAVIQFTCLSAANTYVYEHTSAAIYSWLYSNNLSYPPDGLGPEGPIQGSIHWGAAGKLPPKTQNFPASSHQKKFVDRTLP